LAVRAQDPEAAPAGRTHYLGRAIAQTMHWTGAAWLLRATREDEENGVALHRWLAVQAGQAVCDLGCGNGYHTLPLARAVGPGGRVFGVELQPQYLTMLAQRAEAAGLGNIVGVASTIDDPKLPAASCDLVLMVDVYHELSHPVRVMRRVREALRPGGRVVLVEFRAEDPAVPIKPEHTMTKAQVLREMASHGFRCVAEHDALPWQHAMAFVPAPDDARLAARETMRGALRAAADGDQRMLAPFLAEGATIGEAPPPDAPLVLRAGPGGTLRAEVSGRRFALTTDADGRTFVAGDDAAPWRRPHGSTFAFYAMHTGTGGGPVAAQAELVGELGFDGLAWGLEELAVARRACEGRGLDVASAYAVLTLPKLAADTDAAEALAPAVAPLRAALADLAGGPGQLWLALRHDGAPRRDPSGDAAALTALRALLPAAREHGVAIALYPHHDFWLETLADALRLAAALDDPRVGVCFNLCHHLRTGGGDPGAALRDAAPRLLAVTVNGADAAGRDWATLIRPLDEGDVELGGLLATLTTIGYRGPIALQGFGIALPAREHLARSLAAWRRRHADASRTPR
ncbi:MAG: methyltransferase domain-containing protein, partial [Planctomycetes bacterium]|nr:methyltransferase domain-containing protein [Planctomycetota bacterium]